MSVPAPPLTVSVYAPDLDLILNVSFPPQPNNVSLPAPPLKTSSPAPPIKVSLPDVPLIVNDSVDVDWKSKAVILPAKIPVRVIKKLESSLITVSLSICIIVRSSKVIVSNPIESVPSVKSETVSASVIVEPPSPERITIVSEPAPLIIVSAPVPPSRVLSPALPFKVSLPEPPYKLSLVVPSSAFRVSLPPLPFNVSAPPLPFKILALLSPFRVSALLPPVKFSKLVALAVVKERVVPAVGVPSSKDKVSVPLPPSSLVRFAPAIVGVPSLPVNIIDTKSSPVPISTLSPFVSLAEFSVSFPPLRSIVQLPEYGLSKSPGGLSLSTFKLKVSDPELPEIVTSIVGVNPVNLSE